MAHRRPIRVLFSSFSVWGGVSRDEPRTVVGAAVMIATAFRRVAEVVVVVRIAVVVVVVVAEEDSSLLEA